jgi:hypothetical protein
MIGIFHYLLDSLYAKIKSILRNLCEEKSMAQNNQAKEKLGEFISKLESLGYKITIISKRPQIYSITDKLVNIRSRGKVKETTYGRVFWYSIAFAVLKEVKWVIYLTTTSDYFYMFPGKFLEDVKNDMYDDTSKAGVGVFNLDWDNEYLELKGETISISKYNHNLINKEDYPTF